MIKRKNKNTKIKESSKSDKPMHMSKPIKKKPESLQEYFFILIKKINIGT